MNMKILNAVAVALAAGLAWSQPAAAGNNDEVVTCKTKTLRGVYEFRASGFAIVNGVALPKAIIETLVFDGRGNVLTPHVSISANGTIIQPPAGAPGIYTVAADCKGTLTFGDAGAVSFDLHVNPYGKWIDMLQTNPNNVMQGRAERVLPLSAWGG
jgi:hypothetical protein